MNTTFTNVMFDSIKEALTKENKSNSYREVLRTEVDNTYIVRLLPNVKDPKKTFFHFYTFSWNSIVNGQTFKVVSPTTWSQRCPISEERFRVYKNGTDKEKEKIKKLIRLENWMVNVLIVNDPKNPDNNGKVKILRFGKQLNKIIRDAMDGEDSEELGARIFDLSEKGYNLKIKVEKQGDFPSYISSKFVGPKAIDGMTEGRAKEILEKGLLDLEAVVQMKSYDELKELFATHFLGKVAPVAEPVAPEVVSIKEDKAKDNKVEVDGEDDEKDAQLKELLDGLDGPKE